MKISEKKTNHLLIVAYSSSEWDNANYAILSVTSQLYPILKEAWITLGTLASKAPVYDIRLWMGNFTFHPTENDKLLKLINELEYQGNGFAYIDPVDPDSQEQLEQTLTARIATVNTTGYVTFKASGKHTSEEYWTASIPLSALEDLP